MMQENRSLDHYYGTLGGYAGFGDTDIVRGIADRPVWDQPDPFLHLNEEGSVLPSGSTAANDRHGVAGQSHASAAQQASRAPAT